MDSPSSERIEPSVMNQTGGCVVAGIDIGTLTCRLLVAEVTDSGGFVERRSDRRVLRLGEGLAERRTLSAPAMTRVIDTLKEWRGVIEQERVDGYTVVATCAVREAANAEEFLRRVKVEAGYTVRVITGQEEAELTFLGIRFGVSQSIKGILGLDIGGGSTEFMFESAPRRLITHSINLGVVTLTEQMLHEGFLLADQVARAREVIRSHVERVRCKLGELGSARLVGTAGTITTVAAMIQKLTTYERARIHNSTVSRGALADLERELLIRTSAQRRDMPGLEPGREDVIVAGVLILRGVMEAFGFESCLVSDFGLREGVVLDLATKRGQR